MVLIELSGAIRALSPDLCSVINLPCCSGLSDWALPDVFQACLLPVDRGGTEGWTAPGFDVDLIRFLPGIIFVTQVFIQLSLVPWSSRRHLSQPPELLLHKAIGPHSQGIFFPLTLHPAAPVVYTCLKLANHLHCPAPHTLSSSTVVSPVVWLPKLQWKLGSLSLLSQSRIAPPLSWILILCCWSWIREGWLETRQKVKQLFLKENLINSWHLHLFYSSCSIFYLSLAVTIVKLLHLFEPKVPL